MQEVTKTADYFTYSYSIHMAKVIS